MINNKAANQDGYGAYERPDTAGRGAVGCAVSGRRAPPDRPPSDSRARRVPESQGPSGDRGDRRGSPKCAWPVSGWASTAFHLDPQPCHAEATMRWSDY